MRRYFVLIIILLIPLIPLGLYALGVIKRTPREPKPVPLTMWITTDSAKTYQSLISEYNSLRPYIKISVEQISREDYATRLKDAWARGKGPDIFELPATWIGEFASDFLYPLPKETKVFTYFQQKILFRTDIQIKQTVIPSLTIPQLRERFADVVGDDVIRTNSIYGLPLSIDTLALYYNRDILRSANIVEPPKTWSQLANIVPKLTVADEQGGVLQSAIAIGTGENVTHAADIISLLFLQDGVTMNTPDGSVLLDASTTSEGTNLGLNALSFYTSFADPGKAVYSWNASQPQSLEAFIRGKAAMYIGYGSDRGEIEAKSSINFGVAPILHLQTDGKDALLTPAGNPLQVNYGNYTVLSVFQRSAYPIEAWNFVQFITKDEATVKRYLETAERVSALRSILAVQANDPGLGVFAQQAISARSWYHGRNANAVEGYLKAMIDNVVTGKKTVLEALTLARKQIELTTK